MRSSGIGQKIFVQFLGFFVCLVLPAFVSAIAPSSVVVFTRENERVTAELSTRIYYVIPYRRVRIEDVRAVDDRHHAGTRVRDRSNPRRDHQSESESFLVVQGRDADAEVSVSPVNIREVLAKAEAFLKDPAQAHLKLTVVANWKFGVIAPALLSPLPIAYLVGLLIGLWKLVAKALRRA